MITEPKSGWSNASTQGNPTNTPVLTMLTKFHISAFFSYNILAKSTIKAIFMNSTGCILKKPNLNHPVIPLVVLPRINNKPNITNHNK
jgi:hypothetical protein